MDGLQVIVLAAGKGTRMPAEMPKMLRPLRARPLLEHVLARARGLTPQRILVVLGHRAEEVRSAVASDDVEIILQPEQRGTGDAVRRAAERLAPGGDVLILYGDVPLLRHRTLMELLELHRLERNAATILSAALEDPRGYGRILRDALGCCCGIVEQRDLLAGQEEIGEVNSGIMAFQVASLGRVLPLLRADNDQREYYLTDTIALLRRQGGRVGCYLLPDAEELRGVNTLDELCTAEQILEQRASLGTPECELCAAPDAIDPASLVLLSGDLMCMQVAPRPFNSGHLIVHPRRHATAFSSLRAEEQQELDRLLRLGEEMLRRAYRFEGLNVGCNSGAGEHLSFHLVPRWGGDLNYLPLLAGLKLVPESPARTWERLREVME